MYMAVAGYAWLIRMQEQTEVSMSSVSVAVIIWRSICRTRLVSAHDMNSAIQEDGEDLQTDEL
ncbi:LOW QUALITY PROTEIN: hypothetical protein CH63R_06369 [Colletotrichum higginsianum IMI 349063]|uniref:Uncharacterized protein n=1 Tax=Colletotrichum higginsianum (strain IMI 349063) TaxID=759273 RepID=A0A1B7YEY7_COLHI|nr:LOW QUALITY PROTEIN: hypothetical protein CH63R_06369 [Colletotrichum higginsianum IMI 349063]OBR10677.1 LOW QUALITY PROTEIN: hypothetical protein CH63R_06369 [Colletotrichum higginsianum IMI 349063]